MSIFNSNVKPVTPWTIHFLRCLLSFVNNVACYAESCNVACLSLFQNEAILCLVDDNKPFINIVFSTYPLYSCGNPESPSILHRCTVMDTDSLVNKSLQFFVYFFDCIIRWESLQKEIYSLDVWCEHSFFVPTMRRSGIQKEADCMGCSCVLFDRKGTSHAAAWLWTPVLSQAVLNVRSDPVFYSGYIGSGNWDFICPWKPRRPVVDMYCYLLVKLMEPYW